MQRVLGDCSIRDDKRVCRLLSWLYAQPLKTSPKGGVEDIYLIMIKCTACIPDQGMYYINTVNNYLSTSKWGWRLKDKMAATRPCILPMLHCPLQRVFCLYFAREVSYLCLSSTSRVVNVVASYIMLLKESVDWRDYHVD